MKRPLPFEVTPRLSSPTKPSGTSENAQLLDLLQQYFGYSSFRGKQEEAIRAVMAGRDCFCLMRTGEGKSLCYEIPALAKPGVVVVISPLIALMESQVASLKKRKISAAFLSSSQPASLRAKIMGDLDSGKPQIRLLYVTPEAIDAGGNLMIKLRRLHNRGLLSLLAVDEAHCISSWGHDFRPSYRRLSILRDTFPCVPLLALTATAAKKVRDDVVQSLRLHEPAILISSFNRPNIFYEVRFKDLMSDPYNDLQELLNGSQKDCAIVYCFKREVCDDIGARLTKDGISCRVYHAGLKASERTKSLDDWTSGRVPVVIATVAFGMGIDRADVRLVVHYNVPKTLEGFYQESGRAGRDLKPARSIIYYSFSDRELMEYLSGQESSKKLAKAEGGRRQSVEEECRHAKKALEKMTKYCEETGCRRKKLLEHFDEMVPQGLCKSSCDACRTPKALASTLQELSMRGSSSFKFAGRNSFITQPTKAKNGFQDSEFWGDGDEDEEDSISGSDDEDEAEEEVSKAKKFGNKNLSVEQKLSAMLKAEEEYNAKQNTSKKLKTEFRTATKSTAVRPSGPEMGFSLASTLIKLPTLPTFSETFRDSARSRIQSAMERLTKEGDSSRLTIPLTTTEVEKCVQNLEGECFRSFGKAGKSFYLSKVAGEVRWLGTASAQECRNRLGQT